MSPTSWGFWQRKKSEGETGTRLNWRSPLNEEKYKTREEFFENQLRGRPKKGKKIYQRKVFGKKKKLVGWRRNTWVERFVSTSVCTGPMKKEKEVHLRNIA